MHAVKTKAIRKRFLWQSLLTSLPLIFPSAHPPVPLRSAARDLPAKCKPDQVTLVLPFPPQLQADSEMRVEAKLVI